MEAVLYEPEQRLTVRQLVESVPSVDGILLCLGANIEERLRPHEEASALSSRVSNKSEKLVQVRL